MAYEDLPHPFFVLAPMDDVTDTVFRQTVAGTAAPDLFFTEFTNVDGLQSVGRPKLLRKLRFVPSETSLVAHIWGLKPENFYKTAQEIADGTFARELGLPEGHNFVGVDLNMGCPAKSEVKAGACSALIRPENRDLAGEIIEATREGLNGRLPLSVKTRLGFSEVDLTWFEYLLPKKLNMLTIHGRTRKEMSKVPAHWDLIGEVAKMGRRLAPDTLIVGNGDVENRTHGLKLAEQYGLDGIMIGRGIFHDPFAFADKTPWETIGRDERIGMYRRHVQLFASTWAVGQRNIKTLNKFCKVYISDFNGAKELREQLMEANSTEDLLTLLDQAV